MYMDAELFFSSSERKPKTLKTYRSLYNNHLKQFEHNGKFRIGDIDLIAKDITHLDVSNNTVLTILAVFINIVEANGRSTEKIKKMQKSLFETKKKDTIERKMSKETLPSYKELIDYNKYLYREKEWKSYLISYLLSTYACRNMDVNVFFITDKKDNNEKDNFILMRKNDCVWIRNDYKTFKSYGVKKITILNKKFFRACNIFIEDGNDRLLQNSDDLYKKIIKHTYKGLSESDICKIVVSDIDLNKNEKRLRDISFSRGTTIEVLLSEYRLKDRV